MEQQEADLEETFSKLKLEDPGRRWALMQARTNEGCGRRTSTLYEREGDDDDGDSWAYPDKGNRYVMQRCKLPELPMKPEFLESGDLSKSGDLTLDLNQI